MAIELERVMNMFGRAFPDETSRATFERLMTEANAKGLNWVQALEYAASSR